MKLEPNLIIFRIPDEDAPEHPTKIRLVELPYLGDVLHSTGQVFMPAEDSSYKELTLSQLVLARTTAEGSLELCRFEITENDNSPSVVHELKHEKMKELVKHLLTMYNQPDETDASEHHH